MPKILKVIIILLAFWLGGFVGFFGVVMVIGLLVGFEYAKSSTHADFMMVGASLSGFICAAIFSLAADNLVNRSRRRPGYCQCGYNLTGNTSGICPECGTPIPNDKETV